MNLSRATEYPDGARELRLTGGVWHYLPRTDIDVYLDPSILGEPITIFWNVDQSTGVGFWDVSPIRRFATYRRHQVSRRSSSEESSARTYVGRAHVGEAMRPDDVVAAGHGATV